MILQKSIKLFSVDLGIIADCKRFLECLNDKNVETIEHSDWVKHCQNNKQKHPFKLGEEDQVFCKPQQTIEYIAKFTNGEAIVTTDVRTTSSVGSSILSI